MRSKRGKRISGEGLLNGKTVEVDDRRERERDVCKTIQQNKRKLADGRRQSVQQENGKRVTRQERCLTDVVSSGVFMRIHSL